MPEFVRRQVPHQHSHTNHTAKRAPVPSPPALVHSPLLLQQPTLGNQALQRRLRAREPQASLTISQPQEPYPLQHAPLQIQRQPDEEASRESSWGRLVYAEETYNNNPQVRPLTDANFWNIFYDRNKVMVVDFWATWCRPCDDVAKVMVSLAKRYRSGPYAGLVKFYHVRWGDPDPPVNPQLTTRFGFPALPVVFFYYTGSGHVPTRDRPLLEGSVGAGDPLRLDRAEQMHDESEYIARIDAILRRHGHMMTASNTSKHER